MSRPAATTRIHDARGTTIVEFALLLPVMLMIICGAIDFGYLYLAQTSLNGAVLEAARLSAASMEKSESERQTAMQAGITSTMGPFKNGTPDIRTVVYRKFGDSTPEPYIDANGNGQYDPPVGNKAGEGFTDRNGNGRWDAATPKTGAATTMGDLGDVVSYSATLNVRHLFGMFGNAGVLLRSTAVVRNEPVRTE